MTRTHTYAVLTISAAAFNEIRSALAGAGYIRGDVSLIDLTGIAIQRPVGDVIETTEVSPGRFEPLDTFDKTWQDARDDGAVR